jgi:hypothetical protein
MLGRDLLDADWPALNDTSTSRQHPQHRPFFSSTSHHTPSRVRAADNVKSRVVATTSGKLGQIYQLLRNGDLIVTSAPRPLTFIVDGVDGEDASSQKRARVQPSELQTPPWEASGDM